jgi:uncharacterized peroxidase-related enzyme
MANDPSVSWFPLGDEEPLAPEIKALYAKCRERIGFVPNVFRAYQWLPERLEAFIAHYDAVMAPTETLTAADREMIAVTVSMLNGCAYCLVSHGYAVRKASKDPVLGDLVTFDHRRAPVTERQHAILRYVEKLTRTPLDCSEADLAELRGHGLADRDLWDVAEVAALFNFTNRLALATGMVPNPEYHAMAR